MKIDCQSCSFSCFEYSFGFIYTKHTFLTKYIYVVNNYFFVFHQFLKLRYLVIDHIISCLFQCTSSRVRKISSIFNWKINPVFPCLISNRSYYSNEHESDLCRNKHYLSSSDNKAKKKLFRPIWDSNP